MTTEDIATRIMDLINSKPQSPRREEILAVLGDATASSLSYMVCPLLHSGTKPTVTVEPNGLVTAQGWMIDPTLKPEDSLLAVLDWLADMALVQRDMRR